MSLATRYLGIALPHPLIVGSSPLTDDIDDVRRLEDAGAAALVLRALYEEEITGEQMDDFFNSESHGESFAEAASYAPEPEFAPGADESPRSTARRRADGPGTPISWRRRARTRWSSTSITRRATPRPAGPTSNGRCSTWCAR